MKVSDPDHAPPEQWRPGVETRMVVSAVNGATQLCIFEQWVAPGAGAPTHSHPVEELPPLFYGNMVQPFGSDNKNLTAYFERLKARPSIARVIEEAEPYFKMVPE